ncbi:viperin family antiviral radical SAM protein [Thermococcus sp.]|uniref:viperin family antiviral radical SAM protein n=1 Tax=Thermococcus sp. TaxID=35749 RepID=UPI00262BA4BC|nr:viperin family antiviral radical SAM protein [Thermococcus sp.]
MTPAAFSFSEIPVAVNWHMLDACNYRCKFCFAKFNNLKGICHDIQKSRTVLLKLKEGGVKKINFTGGEPLLCPTLGELIKYAKELGMATSIVTNGYYLTENPGKELLKEYGEYIDWIGMSLDSGNPEVELALGRAHLGQDGGHVKRVRGAVRLIKKVAPKIQIKINTVVTRLNWKEDMHWVIEELTPERWKVFQLKIVPGVNEGSTSLAITEEQFREFVNRHADLNPIAEDNDLMTHSYLMIDPLGRFYDEESQLSNWRNSLVEATFKEALRGLKFNPLKFVQRGGIYDWGGVK